uniref:SGNH/GDSL hydrolase family protein n=1 Tax=Desulfatirhabdium butyrativorans TaxID=340467 RepID=A0A7C4RNL8_9BACT
MTIFLFVVFALIGLILLAEGISRLAFLVYFHIPFHDRRIAEYPYRLYLEKTDPPVHVVFKKGFRSPKVNINRFGLRGDEPAVDGTKRRILVVGESPFFGPKLRDESLIWSKQLQQKLAKSGHEDWEVINGGTPLYNSAQHWYFWENALSEVNPEILVVALGANDVAQMTVFGERWQPGVHWPFEFLLKLERKGTWWNSFLSRFCFYFWLRRLFEGAAPKGFPRGEGALPWVACKQHILNQYRNFYEFARQKGVRIAFSNSLPAYNLEVTAEDERRLSSIQRNYRESIERDGYYLFDLRDAVANQLCPELNIPYLDLKIDLDQFPHRYECWYDLGHWNERGMTFMADVLYKRIDQLGWWDHKTNS